MKCEATGPVVLISLGQGGDPSTRPIGRIGRNDSHEFLIRHHGEIGRYLVHEITPSHLHSSARDPGREAGSDMCCIGRWQGLSCSPHRRTATHSPLRFLLALRGQRAGENFTHVADAG